MLTIGRDLLINESQIVVAEREGDKAVKITFAVPVDIPQKVEGHPNQALFTGYAAAALWHKLTEGARQVNNAPTEFIPPFSVER
jgi:hypothetical protein